MDATTLALIDGAFRWIHVVAGIIWIGHLYFFNFVNANFAGTLDADSKKKVVPQLMPRALFWFRWGAVATWLSGFIYFAWNIVLDQASAERGSHMVMGVWLVLWLAAWAILFGVLRPLTGALNKGIVVGVITAVVVTVAAAVLVTAAADGLPSNRTMSIGIGGGLGTIMLLNVWGIIWPAQKRIIAWTQESAAKGTAMPAEAASLARRAFLASRMNTWLSLPMVFFMGAAFHFPIFG
jgi:uncharacterized membrane protein